MWLKFVLSGAIIAFCVFLGYLAASKYRMRKKFYSQLCKFNERYLTELSYTRRPFSEFLKEYNYTGDFAKLLSRFQEKRNFEIKVSYLTKEERNECGNYFELLGKGDAYSQKGYFEMQKSSLEEKKTKSEKDAKARSELYLKLGLLAGLAVVILIV